MIERSRTPSRRLSSPFHARSVTNPAIPNIAPPSHSLSFSVDIAAMKIAKASISPIFAIHDPTAFPYASPTFPSPDDHTLVMNSGAVVAKLTIVRPIIAFGTPSLLDIAQAESTKVSPDFQISATLTKRAMKYRIASLKGFTLRDSAASIKKAIASSLQVSSPPPRRLVQQRIPGAHRVFPPFK